MCRGDHWSPANLMQQRVFQDRHRRRGESAEKVRRQLSDQSATRFDPAFVQAMLEIM